MREYKYIDPKRIDEDIASGKTKPVTDEPGNVLYDTLLDLLQLARDEGMTEDEVDAVVRRVHDYRAEQHRKRFRLHTQDG